jgi:manganese/zinc/iron transport system permease protein
VQVVLAALFGPRHGVLGKALRRWSLSRRIAREDILGSLYRAREAAMPQPLAPAAAHRGLSGRLAWAGLRWRRWVRRDDSGWVLSPAAIPHAQRIIASHRLWESFLSESLELPESHLHDPSERTEHFIPPEVEAELRRRFEGRTDPQGKPIP